MEVCTACNRPFKVTTMGLMAPGGKEKEPIICPHCENVVRTELTACTFKSSRLTADEEATWLCGQSE